MSFTGCPCLHLAVVWLQTVLHLSPKQIQDLMFLRRTFFLRRQELAVQRAKLTQQMQDGSASTLAHATRVNEIADSLCDNAAADHQNAHRFPWATYFGVSWAQALPVDVCRTMLVIGTVCMTKAYGHQTAAYIRWGQCCADDFVITLSQSSSPQAMPGTEA